MYRGTKHAYCQWQIRYLRSTYTTVEVARQVVPISWVFCYLGTSYHIPIQHPHSHPHPLLHPHPHPSAPSISFQPSPLTFFILRHSLLTSPLPLPPSPLSLTIIIVLFSPLHFFSLLVACVSDRSGNFDLASFPTASSHSHLSFDPFRDENKKNRIGKVDRPRDREAEIPTSTKASTLSPFLTFQPCCVRQPSSPPRSSCCLFRTGFESTSDGLASDTVTSPGDAFVVTLNS